LARVNYQFRFDLVWGSVPELLVGAWLTIQLSMIAMAIGVVVAILSAVARMVGPPPLKWAIGAYVEVIRNTPFLVQIFIVFFGLPTIGIRLDPNASALFAMVLNVAAYVTEILRAGIESVPKGQTEAGAALGLTRLQIFRNIVLKPAIKSVYPALTSQYVLLMLQSSVISAISADELTAIANDVASRTFASFEVYIIVTVIYFSMGIAFSSLFAVLSRSIFSYPDR
jgi:polar amino acid transport system permease protein